MKFTVKRWLVENYRLNESKELLSNWYEQEISDKKVFVEEFINTWTEKDSQQLINNLNNDISLCASDFPEYIKEMIVVRDYFISIL